VSPYILCGKKLFNKKIEGSPLKDRRFPICKQMSKLFMTKNLDLFDCWPEKEMG